MKSIKAATLGAAPLSAILAPGAAAEYFQYGTLSAHEGGRLVARGYGSHGMDFSHGRVGGTHTVRDPRPGGSPASGKVLYQYTSNSGAVGAWQQVSAPPNYTGSWITRTATHSLNLNNKFVTTKPQVCQRDDWAPDDCATGAPRNHKI